MPVVKSATAITTCHELALITDADSRLGLKIARVLTRHGIAVCLVGPRAERLKVMVDALGENEAGVFSICADVRDAEDVRRVRRFVRDQGMIVASEVGALGMHR